MAKFGDGVRVGMLLTSPAGNDLPYDDSLCEQGRNFGNKMRNAFRLVKGFTVDDEMQPASNAAACAWMRSRVQRATTEMMRCTIDSASARRSWPPTS